MKIALRVDVDTFRGTRRGVPELCRIFDRHGIRAAFFFSVGPDNMGRHCWRLLKPKFLWKMLRTNAASLYGPEILLRGTFFPGPRIGRANADAIRDCVGAGHEFGVHAWDHHAWQANIERMDVTAQYAHIERAVTELTGIAGRAPDCSAAPGWRANDATLMAKERFGFRYNSDCRGRGVFLPEVAGQRLLTPQVPVNLPTYDEALGRGGVTDENYNERLLKLAQAAPEYNVLTIHAEAEGGKCVALFEDFIQRALALGVEFITPGELLFGRTPPPGVMAPAPFPGREGWLATRVAADARG